MDKNQKVQLEFTDSIKNIDWLKEEIKNMSFYPVTLAQWIDQHLILVEKSKQRYGSVANMNGELFAASNIEDINKRRQEICLEPIEDYI